MVIYKLNKITRKNLKQRHQAMRNKILTYLLLLPLLCLAQGQAENRIVVSSYLDADGSDSICKILYYDELGREEQKVIVGGSPIGKSKEVDI